VQPEIKYVEEYYGDQINVIFHDVWTNEGLPDASIYGLYI
jgi:hypothetical protein